MFLRQVFLFLVNAIVPNLSNIVCGEPPGRNYVFFILSLNLSAIYTCFILGPKILLFRQKIVANGFQ